MRKSIIFICLILIISLKAKAQIYRMVSMPKDGLREYLYFNSQKDVFEYASNKNPSRVKLVTVKVSPHAGSLKTYQVKFPTNPKQIYKLTNNGESFECINPDGTKQEFTGEDKFYYKKENKVTEYLYLGGLPGSFYVGYSSTKNSAYVDLTIIEADIEANKYKVKFPGSKEVYILSPTENTVECTNPDGSKQIFLKEKY